MVHLYISFSYLHVYHFTKGCRSRKFLWVKVNQKYTAATRVTVMIKQGPCNVIMVKKMLYHLTSGVTIYNLHDSCTKGENVWFWH